MRQKVKDKFIRMKRNGIIERVKQPIDWCSPKVLFFFKKTTGKACICIDPKKLNEAIKKTLHSTYHKKKSKQS